VFSHPQDSRAPSCVTVTPEGKCRQSQCPPPFFFSPLASRALRAGTTGTPLPCPAGPLRSPPSLLRVCRWRCGPRPAAQPGPARRGAACRPRTGEVVFLREFKAAPEPELWLFHFFRRKSQLWVIAGTLLAAGEGEVRRSDGAAARLPSWLPCASRSETRPLPLLPKRLFRRAALCLPAETPIVFFTSHLITSF